LGRSDNGWHRIAAASATLAVVFASLGCGLVHDTEFRPTPTPVAGNALVNPGFEDGSAPWTSRSAGAPEPIVVTGGVAHAGAQSLLLALEPSSAPGGVAGVDQLALPREFPEFVSGYYFVEQWDADDGVPYLEFVVAPQGADPPVPALRFVLGGIEREPAELPDARVVMVSRARPAMGKWTYFSYPVRQAFLDRVGQLPGIWLGIALRLELRHEGTSAPAARVYLDDLYMGPQAGNPNRPD
jgi:hypothetical protein